MNYPRWWVLPRKTSDDMLKHSRKDCRGLKKTDAEPMLRSGIKLNGAFGVCKFCSGEFEPSGGGDYSYYRRAVEEEA